LKLNRSNAVAHADLGDILLEARKPDEAIGQYQRAVAIDPDFSYAHTGLGMAPSQTGEIDELSQKLSGPSRSTRAA
jgi:tetratricopeptide (TPR) repeat protein